MGSSHGDDKNQSGTHSGRHQRTRACRAISETPKYLQQTIPAELKRVFVALFGDHNTEESLKPYKNVSPVSVEESKPLFNSTGLNHLIINGFPTALCKVEMDVMFAN